MAACENCDRTNPDGRLTCWACGKWLNARLAELADLAGEWPDLTPEPKEQALQYKGYVATVDYSEAAAMFRASFRHVTKVWLEARTLPELQLRFQELVDSYLAVCGPEREESSARPPRPH